MLLLVQPPSLPPPFFFNPRLILNGYRLDLFRSTTSSQALFILSLPIKDRPMAAASQPVLFFHLWIHRRGLKLVHLFALLFKALAESLTEKLEVYLKLRQSAASFARWSEAWVWNANLARRWKLLEILGANFKYYLCKSPRRRVEKRRDVQKKIILAKHHRTLNQERLKLELLPEQHSFPRRTFFTSFTSLPKRFFFFFLSNFP